MWWRAIRLCPALESRTFLRCHGRWDYSGYVSCCHRLKGVTAEMSRFGSYVAGLLLGVVVGLQFPMFLGDAVEQSGFGMVWPLFGLTCVSFAVVAVGIKIRRDRVSDQPGSSRGVGATEAISPE